MTDLALSRTAFFNEDQISDVSDSRVSDRTKLASAPSLTKSIDIAAWRAEARHIGDDPEGAGDDKLGLWSIFW